MATITTLNCNRSYVVSCYKSVHCLYCNRCKKTYEANEIGCSLDALTDLTGDICEFYNPDTNPDENLFHVLYKSCVNRSLIVCWRNDKRLTPTGFMYRNKTDMVREIKFSRFMYTCISDG